MTGYIPLLILAGILLTLLVWVAMPWLKAKDHRDKAVTAMLVTLFLTLALYLAVGSPFKMRELSEQQVEHTTMLQRIVELEKKSAEAAEEDALPHAELGAAYIHTEQYGKAVVALKEAVKRSDGQPELILMFGKAQMMEADGQITEGAKQAFEMAAKLMPDNPDPAMMLAMERMQAGDTKGAKERMRALLPNLPEGIPLRRMIEQQLKEENTSGK